LFAHIFISWCYYRHIGQQEGEVSLFNNAEAVDSLTESTSLSLMFHVRTIVSLACCCALLLLLTNPSSSLLSSQTMECGEFMSEGTPLTNVSCVPTICLWDCMHVLLIHPLLLSLSVCLSPPRSCVGILLFWDSWVLCHSWKMGILSFWDPCLVWQPWTMGILSSWDSWLICQSRLLCAIISVLISSGCKWFFLVASPGVLSSLTVCFLNVMGLKRQKLRVHTLAAITCQVSKKHSSVVSL
jgi:hypothetical protein